MPRSIWNGTISFGLVSVPVKAYSATESKTVRFHQVHAKDGARVEHRRTCPLEDRDVPYDEVVKGYEVGPDEYIVLTDGEVKAAAGARGKVVELEDFVDAREIDPVFYERTYYLGAREAPDAYALLHDALQRTGRAGIGRWTFHNREYLVAIRSLDGMLALHTMRFADEVVGGAELEIATSDRPPSEPEVQMAGALVESLHRDFEPSAYEDSYRGAVLALIERKAAGEEITSAPAQETGPAPDLLAALQASLAAAGDGAGARG